MEVNRSLLTKKKICLKSNIGLLTLLEDTSMSDTPVVPNDHLNQEHLKRHEERLRIAQERTTRLQQLEAEIDKLEERKSALKSQITTLEERVGQKEQEIRDKEAHLAAMATESERFHGVVRQEADKQFEILDRIMKKLTG